MLMRFGAKNFFCFKDWVEIDLTFNSKVPDDVRTKGDVAEVLCLKGANSSGKTNALKILSFISSFATKSFDRKPDEELQLDSYFENKDPVEFFVEFSIGTLIYTYELVVTNSSVLSEKLYRKEKRKTLVLERTESEIVKNVLFDSKKEITFRKNASIISTARQYQISEIDPIYHFFDSFVCNVNYSGHRHDFFDHSVLSEYYTKHPDVLEFVKAKIREFDTGVVDISIQSYDNEKSEKRFYPVFTHVNGDKTGSLLYYFESSGTKSLYIHLAFYFLTIRNGGVLVLDEFDINLHPDILPKLLDIFENVESNPKRAQLVFSTHNSDILDRMGKYRTVLFNKEDGASYCYRLDELPPEVVRNDRPIEPLYRSGRLGGVPKL
jgi:AAA15 family ATPase/GTPase